MYRNDIDVNAVILQTGISTSAARLFFVISRYVNVSRARGILDRRGVPYCFASHETLAQQIGKSTSTVSRCIRELVKAGMIVSRRTKKNGHITISWYGCVGHVDNDNSANIKNDKSILEGNNSFKQNDTSIYPVTPAIPDLISSAAERCHEYAKQPAAAEKPENSQDNQQIAPQPARQRKPRITKAIKEQARQRYYELLARKLELSNIYCNPEEYQQTEAICTMIADAMSCPGRRLKVNGRYMSTAEYWSVVKDISILAIDGLADRVESQRITAGVTNVVGYTLASIYNAVVYHRLSTGARLTARAYAG